MNIVTVFMLLQVILILFMTFHDWRVLPTNIREMEKNSKKMPRLFRLSNFSVPLFLTWYYNQVFLGWFLFFMVYYRWI